MLLQQQAKWMTACIFRASSINIWNGTQATSKFHDSVLAAHFQDFSQVLVFELKTNFMAVYRLNIQVTHL